jgi:hypothetical protein
MNRFRTEDKKIYKPLLHNEQVQKSTQASISRNRSWTEHQAVKKEDKAEVHLVKQTKIHGRMSHLPALGMCVCCKSGRPGEEDGRASGVARGTSSERHVVDAGERTGVFFLRRERTGRLFLAGRTLASVEPSSFSSLERLGHYSEKSNCLAIQR